MSDHCNTSQGELITNNCDYYAVLKPGESTINPFEQNARLISQIYKEPSAKCIIQCHLSRPRNKGINDILNYSLMPVVKMLFLSQISPPPKHHYLHKNLYKSGALQISFAFVLNQSSASEATASHHGENLDVRGCPLHQTLCIAFTS